ncbi:MAG TPA: MazF family transcriptional regulator [Actinobacteria bacterium]|nr:MazF family transcriptional regulator [Actinomycetota bacterium]
MTEFSEKMQQYPERGEIWLTAREPVKGSEIGKTRPALVISNNKNNEFSSTITVIPITSSLGKVYPFEVAILKYETGLKSDSKIKCNQIRTVDRERLIKPLSKISMQTMKQVENALLIHLEINNSDF